MTRPTSDAADRPRRGWPTRDVLRVVAVVIGVYVALRLLWAVSDVLLLTFLGLLFGLALSAGVDQLQRLRVPRAVGAAAIVLTTAALFVGLGRLLAPTLAAQWQQLGRQLPEVIERAQSWVQAQEVSVVELLGNGRAGAPPPDQPARERTAQEPAARDRAAQERAPPGGVTDGLMEQLGGVGRHFFSIFSSTLAAIGGILLVLFVAIYVAVEPRVYEQGLMHLVPHRARPRAREVLARVAYMLRSWLVTQLIAMVAIGVLTTAVLWLLDVRAAVALGVLAGLLEFVPIAGPIIASIPAIGMGLLDGVDKALYVALAFIGIQQVESQLITPLLMKERLELPPVLTIVGQAVMAIVFGFMGLLVAVPLLGAGLVTVKMLYVQDVVGDKVPLPGEDEAKVRGAR